MARKKSDAPRKYEIVVVLDPTLKEEEIKLEVSKIKRVIEKEGGEEISIEPWGRLRLAYPMKKHNYGVYVAFLTTTKNFSLPSEVESILRITDSVLRFKTHRLSEKERKRKVFKALAMEKEENVIYNRQVLEELGMQVS